MGGEGGKKPKRNEGGGNYEEILKSGGLERKKKMEGSQNRERESVRYFVGNACCSALFQFMS